MFDVGFTELLLVAVVALVVLGPERLPGAARTAGQWVGRARATVSRLTTELERELRADELRRSLREEARALEQTAASLRDLDPNSANDAARQPPAPPGAPQSSAQALPDDR